jgi:hypothetical protein
LSRAERGEATNLRWGLAQNIGIKSAESGQKVLPLQRHVCHNLKKTDNIMLALKSKASRGYSATMVPHDDTLMGKEEFFAKIDRALQDIKDGKGTAVCSKEELKAYLDSL